ncbi:uncharacterized protein PFL1_00623 [Pseudozyma flocculosa PF-1]|uniref:Related to DAL5 - Allantoate and ureidosuccinate permease n=1 Tax=Pseudozyma flocculosa TaxID=84751 RepID=A0A5C3EU27_9BASI|nr:uncharacterized protein PFL1_00623 [Pseudozyma flocculosa PF-1]EPQ32427.1 hypothetical protein PFL1_00623 [Pseudozyma flocculosa PF-1]SPO34589.1 related to DAL5 - Allantoate and ureidosuccinate permease [Pseudozyma flocculosa]
MASDGATVSERRLLLRIDLLLMPIMTIAYGLQFYDKAILSSASIFGILADLDLSVTHGTPPTTSLQRYSTATSAFYWGYLVAALPMALLVQRYRANWFLGLAVVLWGIIVILTPAITSWRGLVAQRFFLGAVESAVSPGFVRITRSWYKRSEQPLRLGIWYSATGLFSIFSGLVNYGWGKLGSQPGAALRPWKYMFLFAGALTIAFGLILLALLPASPTQDAIIRVRGYNYFDAASKRLASTRLRDSLTGVASDGDDGSSLGGYVTRPAAGGSTDSVNHNHKQQQQQQQADGSVLADTKGALRSFDDEDVESTADGSAGEQSRWQLYQVKEALLDYKIWIFFLQAIAIYICNGGVTGFGAYIIKTFGYSSLRSIILQTPGGATTAVSIYISTFIVLKTKNTRSLLLCLTCLPVMAGAAMIWKGDWTNRAVPLAGYYLLPIFGAPFVLMLSLSTANIAGSTKLSIASAMIFIGYNVGNIVAPYLTKAEQKAIHYRDTFVAIITCMAITIALTVLLDVGMWYQNRTRDRAAASSTATGRVGDGETEQQVRIRAVKEDWTDWENPHFRYVF